MFVAFFTISTSWCIGSTENNKTMMMMMMMMISIKTATCFSTELQSSGSYRKKEHMPNTLIWVLNWRVEMIRMLKFSHI